MRRGDSGRLGAVGLATVAVLPVLTLAILPSTGVRLRGAAFWWTYGVAIAWLAGGLTAALRSRDRMLQRLAGLLQGLRAEDYALRLRTGRGPAGNVAREFNALAAHLGAEQRHGRETDALLSQLLASLELGVLIVDEQDRLVELNPAAEAMLGETASELIGQAAAQLGLSPWLQCPVPFIDRRDARAGEGPWEVRRVVFRRLGRPHRLLVVTDVSHALREQERHAWRRLIRVLGHELNNSLGSVQATANLLRERSRLGDPTLDEGLELIERRSRTLGNFIRRYSELARLPPPTTDRVELAELIRHVAALEERITVTVESVGKAIAFLDRTQFEQALINLVRNAAEASIETGGGVRIRWSIGGQSLKIEVEDDGPGIASTENLFVPFFTTKPGGSGIGLLLARQVIEAHGGSLRLLNRESSHGTVAVVRLPVKSAQDLLTQSRLDGSGRPE